MRYKKLGCSELLVSGLCLGGMLFDHLGTGPVKLEPSRVVEVPEGVTHLRFRIHR